MKVVPAITGIGLITPLGRSTADTWQALLAGRFISTHTRMEAAAKSAMPRVNALAIEAAQQAIAEAKWNDTAQDAAVICCTSKGAVESWMDDTYANEQSTFGLADLSTGVARHFGLMTGPRLTLSAACASGLHGVIRAAIMILSGQATRVLVVAAEASVHPLFLGSFHRLGVLAPDGELCRPFDRNRQGFLMSDAAAAVCVQGINPADPPDHFATIERFALGGDATHLTGSDPHGTVLCRLLRQAIADQPVDLIHAHGTGTTSNDSTELAAMEATLPHGKSSQLFSHKAALGHSLGASGLVSVVINCLIHQTGFVPGNVNTIDPLPISNLSISQGIEKRQIHRSLIHAAGFGGPTAVVTLRSNFH